MSWLSAVVLALTMAGCGGATKANRPDAAAGKATPGFPVTIMSCGQPVIFDRAPQRAVSNDIALTEDMLALGLAPRMVGTFGVSDPMPAQYQAAFHRVPTISTDYVELEPLVGLHPDFLFAGWNYGLTQSKNLTPDNLAHYGVKTYVLEESCAHVQSGKSTVSIDDTYADLRNLGAIFGVRQRAEQLISSMQAQIASLRPEIAGLPPVPVFLYDSGQDAPFTAPALALPNDLITRAGGANVFADLRQTWTSVSWEQVVAREPACIVINDYSTPSWQQKQQFLQGFALTKNLPAVQHDCFLHLSYDQLSPGPRNAEAILALARWLHPKAFGLAGH
jgi:iron complex transport system substrate-binding protein